MTSHAAHNLLAILEVVLVLVACFYVALAAATVYVAVDEFLASRADRRRWQEIDSEAKALRAELDDDAALAEWAGRAV